MFYFARCINIVFNSLLAQLVKYDVHTTQKIKFIHAIIYHISLSYCLYSLLRTGCYSITASISGEPYELSSLATLLFYSLL